MEHHTGTITNGQVGSQKWADRKAGLSSVLEFETDRILMPLVQRSYEVEGMVSTSVLKLDNQQLKKMQLGIDTSMINQPMREFLGVLKKEVRAIRVFHGGFEAYLVGGCVRDLMLKKIPRSYEVITSAKLEQILSCNTNTPVKCCDIHRYKIFSVDLLLLMKSSSVYAVCVLMIVLWRLLFDISADIVYDFVGGIDDIKKRQVCTITPGKFYFDMDPVQILRAVGVAAQLKFELESNTSVYLKDLSHNVLTIEREITLHEFHRILAFGYAKDSWMLLWRVGLLEIVIPGKVFASKNVEESNMLLKMFSKLDGIVEPDIGIPSPKKLWVTIFYFYLALVRKPRDPRVIAAFTLAICSGYFSEAAKRVIHIPHQSHDTTLCELSTSQGLGEDEIKEQVLDLITSVMDVISTTRQGVVPFKMMRKVRLVFGGIKWDFEHERERDETRREARRILEGDEMDEGDEVCWSDDEYWDMTYRKEGHRRMLECGESTFVFAMIVYSTFFPVYASSTVS
ncbi:hypothetical protein EZV62_014565 [Acer yangbiense]|uniref:tRNA nucleotidyltransferase/poly(A) polymerase RNA and SrmB- binding domain-containing protein n=1 Tax=Acer yangbiense TaxID=1000413 RepID=A0A5C7HV02_9ROSI|nr:hypothetical protein EZV62_014565 [Acer yangbiense]